MFKPTSFLYNQKNEATVLRLLTLEYWPDWYRIIWQKWFVPNLVPISSIFLEIQAVKQLPRFSTESGTRLVWRSVSYFLLLLEDFRYTRRRVDIEVIFSLLHSTAFTTVKTLQT